MSVLSLFHPNPYDKRALQPGYSRPHTAPVPREPLPPKEPKKEETTEEGKGGAPKVVDPNTKFIEYKVRASDDLDLWNIAATYGVRVEDIRRYNRRVVFDYLDNVIGETIYIPINVQEGDHVPKQPEPDHKKIAEFKFVKETGCSHAEAKYYLEEAEWEFEKALKTFREDVSWEKSKESKDKAMQLEKLKLESNSSVTPTEKLVAAITPVTTTTQTPTSQDVISSSHSSINFPPPSYSFEGLSSSTSMQPLPTPTAPPPSSSLYPSFGDPSTTAPPWEPQNLKSLKKPLLES